MKLLTYLAPGAKITSVPSRAWQRMQNCEGEILREAAYQRIYSTIIRFRRIGDTTWCWRGVETDGAYVWYWDIAPDAAGNVLAPGALRKHGDLPGFGHGPAYEYMVEGFAPLAVDSPDWLIAPAADDRASIAQWRAKLTQPEEEK